MKFSRNMPIGEHFERWVSLTETSGRGCGYGADGATKDKKALAKIYPKFLLVVFGRPLNIHTNILAGVLKPVCGINSACSERFMPRKALDEPSSEVTACASSVFGPLAEGFAFDNFFRHVSFSQRWPEAGCVRIGFLGSS